MRFRPAHVLIPLSLAAVPAIAVSACSGQGEGQLCNPKAGNSGNDDCQSGLTCQPRPATVINGFGLCCPPGGQSTTSACAVNGGPSNDASSAPPTQEASPDAPGESAAEVGPGTDGSDAGPE
jgi:hypothetical protein